MGKDEKFYVVNRAALTIRTNSQTTWEMFKEACVWIMEVYGESLRTECEITFLDNNREGNVGYGYVTLLE